jgi:tRNA A37 threonylcarbamoyladenosine dehydratase
MNILDATHAFANPGEDSLIDCIDSVTGKSCVYGETLESNSKIVDSVQYKR